MKCHNLRDRIAAVIASGRMDRSNYEMADAVIRELGLTRVTRSERVPIYRYVTEWTTE
jgi:hypothetical protein